MGAQWLKESGLSFTGSWLRLVLFHSEDWRIWAGFVPWNRGSTSLSIWNKPPGIDMTSSLPTLGQGPPRWGSKCHSQESDTAQALMGSWETTPEWIWGERKGPEIIPGDCTEEAPLSYVQERALEERLRLRN